jgi:malate dehydrogenase (oxaloacetate-decarboxylating)(NADP+)
VAAQAVAEQVGDAQLKQGLIYPPQSEILEASTNVAIHVANYIFDYGLTSMPRPVSVEALIHEKTYRPEYRVDL